MATCRYCGQEIKDYQKYCSYCGAEQLRPQEPAQPVEEPAASTVNNGGVTHVSAVTPTAANTGYTETPSQAPASGKGNIGWGFLGCCVPIVGLILFLTWKDSKPSDAKAAGIGGLIGFGLGILSYILGVVLGVLSEFM